MSTTRHTICAAISIGLPRRSLTLILLGNEIVRAHRQLVTHHPRQHPAQARRPVGPGVGAEQGDRGSLIGLQHVEARGDETDREHTADGRPQVGRRRRSRTARKRNPQTPTTAAARSASSITKPFTVEAGRSRLALRPITESDIVRNSPFNLISYLYLLDCRVNWHRRPGAAMRLLLREREGGRASLVDGGSFDDGQCRPSD